MATTARKIQQDYLVDFGDRDWDEYTIENQYLIRMKIGFAMFGPPSSVGDLFNNSDENSFGYTENQMAKIKPIFLKICSFGRYSGDNSTVYMSILFACCVPIDPKINEHYYDNLESEEICCSPIFKIRRCIKLDNSDGKHGCCIFVDDLGRVYPDWASYLDSNKLPKGMIVAPEDGRYHGILCGEEMEVSLQQCYSPACSTMATVNRVGEKIGTAVALGAVGVFGFSLFAPVAVPVAIVTGAASAITGGFGAVMSSRTLIDRKQHEQTVGLSDAEARGCWLNIGAGAAGAAAGASTTLLSKAVKNGAVIGQGLRAAHNATIVLAALSSSAGIINSIATLITRYNETGEGPTSLELFQLASSVMFLGHSLMSTRMASTIIEETQASQINDYRSSLRSNKHRKMYDKMVAETRRTNGVVKGNAEVIRSVKTIVNKNDFFQDALRMNKQLNEQKVKISFKDGSVYLNNEHMITPNEFFKMSVGDRSAYLQRMGPSTMNARNVPINLTSDVHPPVNFVPILRTLMSASSLIAKFPVLAGSNEDIIQFIVYQLSQFTESVQIYFTNILNGLLQHLNLYAREQLNALNIRDDDIFYRLFQYLMDYLKKLAGSEMRIPEIIEEFIVDGRVSERRIMDLARGFEKLVNKEYRPISPREVRCAVCNGITFSQE